MVQCLQLRFGDIRAPHKVQWLKEWIDLPNQPHPQDRCRSQLEPSFTSVESPESLGGSLRQDLQARLCAYHKRGRDHVLPRYLVSAMAGTAARAHTGTSTNPCPPGACL